MKLELSTLFRRQVTFKTAKSNMGKRLQIKKKKTLLYPYLQTLWSNSCAVGCALKEKVGQGGLAVTPFRRVTTPWNTLPPPSISPNQSLSLKLFIFKINKQKSDYFLELVMISLPVPVALTRGPIKWFHFFFFEVGSGRKIKTVTGCCLLFVNIVFVNINFLFCIVSPTSPTNIPTQSPVYKPLCSIHYARLYVLLFFLHYFLREHKQEESKKKKLVSVRESTNNREKVTSYVIRTNTTAECVCEGLALFSRISYLIYVSI